MKKSYLEKWKQLNYLKSYYYEHRDEITNGIRKKINENENAKM